jgi:hypothetical protein
MKDPRVTTYRKALEALIESLDAIVRLKRWTDGEAPPEPLKQSASALVTRLGTAGRLASSHFTGSVADVSRVGTMRDAMRRLDTAYVNYRHALEGTQSEQLDAESNLRSEIDETTAGAL